MAVAD